MGLCAEQLYKLVLMFFQKNEKHLIFSRNTTKWFYIFFGDLARGWDCLYKMVSFFSKNNEYPYKMVCSFLGKCKLIDSK